MALALPTPLVASLAYQTMSRLRWLLLFASGATCDAGGSSWSLVKVTDQTKFNRLYRAQVLDKLKAEQVIRDLGGDDFLLLCWEAPGQFCHRRVVAAWLEKELGLKVEEFNHKLRRHQAWLRTMQEREK